MKNDNKTRIILNILKIGVYLDGITTYIALSQGRQEINGIFYLIYHFAKHIFPAILIWIISVLLIFKLLKYLSYKYILITEYRAVMIAYITLYLLPTLINNIGAILI